MSDRARLAMFLSLWLKKYIVSTPDIIAAGMILLAVCLTYEVLIALVPAVSVNIQSVLQHIVASFLAFLKQNPRIKLAYTYIVTWYALHCPALMTPMPPHNAAGPLIQHLAESSWTVYSIRGTLSAPKHYQLYQFPS